MAVAISDWSNIIFHPDRTELKMDIDLRDIKKGPLPETLPELYPNSISYLRELNEYRMYAEIWSNNRNTAWQKRKEIGHEGYLKTLAMGETVKRRKIDKVRFNFIVVADSVNYTVKGVYNHAHAIIGDMQNNAIINNIIKENQNLLKVHSQFQSVDFHAEEYVPEPLEIDLRNLDLQKDTKEDKHFFQILTNAKEIPNINQRLILLHLFGEDAISKRLPLLYKANRKAIRFLFVDPVFLERGKNAQIMIPRLCVARPFDETMVIDFAAKLEDYEKTCLLGTPIKQADQAGKKWYEKIIS
ncbi:MAG: hypothetical protein R2568_06940 [Candidatus Scalindua sp.]|jgi:hypothetical protein|nr:hypothetical protein [Candidatus Scalindua sp.]MDV5166470.1 hypothetical protein [Candidatus Scalindua sp.]